MLKGLKRVWQRLTGEQVVVSGAAIAKWLGPTRMYDSARPSRLTGGWGNLVTSADNEIKQSIRTLRSRSRQLCRDSSYAKRAKGITVNNIIGGGIGLQAQ